MPGESLRRPYSSATALPTTPWQSRPSSSTQAAKVATAASKSKIPAKVVVPVTAVLVLGVAATQTMSSFTGPRKASVDPMQERNNALLDAYGDGTSLEDLQKAMDSYEKR
ncbi:hypothetical protein K402DRAFT_389468 [Aulographum hederae CBS 113979]|uniref:Uncharacterized protein n=1 Tax=Aulographum hederae CBS 113979 TaxID=1176131 RepID=A0A6G1HED6_9PEZI|nr:hypothetical protein K402DRAFT_389468 [Aulographum hederae CBS 113979]